MGEPLAGRSEVAVEQLRRRRAPARTSTPIACIAPAYLPVGRRGSGGRPGPRKLLPGWATIRTRGPLAGVRVLELGSFIAGPFSGQLLGDYGADVVKVEPPGEGDPMRRWGVTLDGDSLWWPAIARNKRSVTLDLRDERARAGHPPARGRTATS